MAKEPMIQTSSASEADTRRDDSAGKRVYVAMCADFIHHGHMNIINHARQLGEVTVGLLSDKAIASFHTLPFLTYQQRAIIVENLKGVANVVEQENLDYEPNLRLLKPHYVVHGDDWREGPQRAIRARVLEILREWDGQLIEVPYTKGISSTTINESLRAIGTTPENRMRRFRRLLDTKPMLSLIEVHNGLTAHMVEHSSIQTDESYLEFDGVWLSSLTDSTAKGKPDIEYVDKTSRLATLNDVLESTTKPIVFDADTGGLAEHFAFTVKSLERIGVCAAVIEDKVGLKRNSLFGNDTGTVTQDDVESFCRKISAGKAAQVTDDFMVIARIESLVLDKGIKDALFRADSYLDAGADAILIHSRSKDGQEVIDFCKKFRANGFKAPLVVVPTAYSHIRSTELMEAGANVVIYANHLIRSAYPAMQRTLSSILKNGRSYECEADLMPVGDLLKLIPGG